MDSAQGVIDSTLNKIAEMETVLPRRYLHALENLSKNNKSTITSSDKDGGVVAIDTDQYIETLESLLKDITYKRLTNA